MILGTKGLPTITILATVDQEMATAEDLVLLGVVLPLSSRTIASCGSPDASKQGICCELV